MDVWQRLGSAAELARRLGVKAPSVADWKLRGIPVERCHVIERLYEGKVHCEELRRDVVWHRVPDSEWPWHPEGRPLVDITRAAESSAVPAAA